MTRPGTFPFTCDACGTRQEATAWHSVNVTVNPELKEQVLDGELFQLRCAHCGAAESVVWDFLYHDTEREFMVFLAPGEGAVPPELDEELGFRGVPALRRLLRHYRFRVVPSVSLLLEKVRIFDDGLDDRVVELLKSWVWKNLFEVGAEGHGTLLYAGTHEEAESSSGAAGREAHREVQDFVLLGEGQRMECSVPRASYDVMESWLRPALEAASAEPLAWLRVDLAYGAALAKRAPREWTPDDA